MSNHCRLRGNLIDKPKLISLKKSGVPFMRFYIAVERNSHRMKVNRNGQKESIDYFQVVSYGNQAAHNYSFLRKGSEVIVEGWIRMRMVPTNGKERRRIYEFVAENIIFLRNIDWTVKG